MALLASGQKGVIVTVSPVVGRRVFALKSTSALVWGVTTTTDLVKSSRPTQVVASSFTS